MIVKDLFQVVEGIQFDMLPTEILSQWFHKCIIYILYLKEDGESTVIMSIHVDDSLCSRSRENLDKLYENVRKKKYKITTLVQISKYLGVQYDCDRDENGED